MGKRMEERDVIDGTRRWVETVVIGLNLCPFARRPFAAGLVRFAVTPATNEEELCRALTAELTSLVATPRSTLETTLLIHPNVLADFLDYNDFLATADEVILDKRLGGIVQIASFHPKYQFAGTELEAVENYTNRSPYPMLHLLREESVSEVNDDPDTLAGIPERNIETMRALGRARVVKLLEAARRSGGA